MDPKSEKIYKWPISIGKGTQHDQPSQECKSKS